MVKEAISEFKRQLEHKIGDTIRKRNKDLTAQLKVKGVGTFNYRHLAS